MPLNERNRHPPHFDGLHCSVTRRATPPCLSAVPGAATSACLLKVASALATSCVGAVLRTAQLASYILSHLLSPLLEIRRLFVEKLSSPASCAPADNHNNALAQHVYPQEVER